MASVPSRKKSLVGANGALPIIDLPQPSNQLLNKSAASSTSLYQQCSQLRAKLIRIHFFAPFLEQANAFSSAQSSSSSSFVSRQSHSTDPVRQLWDCFALGTPLCFLYNLLPGQTPLNVNTDPDALSAENVKDRKKATAKFIIAITAMKNAGEWGPGDVFTISELHSESRDTNGFVKVVNTVSKLVDLLPPEVFKPEEAPPSPPALPATVNTSVAPQNGLVNGTPVSYDSPAPGGADVERNKVIRELVETERKYVGDLEVMREYATALGASGVMDQDTIHLLFPGLNQLLDFQRQFLIILEGIYEQPWQQQRWGSAFASKEDEFAVYEPYCANYTNAAELLLVEEQNLMALSDLLNPRSELPAFLIKPVQRICKYPLLLESLVKRAGPDYSYKEELIEGWNVTKRITDRVNEAQRREENMQTVKNLETRVEDWKGHHISHFGQLLLDEIFFVTKSDVDREYHVFLFEKIILCCKEAGPPAPGDKRKSGKSNSMLKKSLTAADKAAAAAAANSPGGGAAGKKRMTPLLLKGRIFLNNVTSAVPSRKDGHALQLWWRGDDDVEYFTLRCRTEEQLKQWESTINRLIANNSAIYRRGSERPSMSNGPHPPPSSSAGQASYTAQQLAHAQHIVGHGQARGRYPSQSSSASQFQGEFPMTPGTPGSNGMYPSGLNNGTGLGLRERKDSKGDAPTDEEYGFGEERGYDSPYSSTGPSGRATPNGTRKPHASLPASQKAVPPINGIRGPITRGMSQTSDSSFGPGLSAGSRTQPPSLKSQFSSNRLRNTFEEQTGGRVPLNQLQQHQQHLRIRSASTPTQYTPGSDELPPLPPPIPITAKENAWSNGPGSISTAVLRTKTEEKRGSGSSQSTNESSDFSVSQTTSPVTPYGSNDSSLASAVRHGDGYNTPIRVKVHFREDLFVIVVQRAIDYQDLMDRVGKKIRLCGGAHYNAAFRVRYKDEDGDMISLASNDDLQIALDNREVVLYVV